MVAISASSSWYCDNYTTSSLSLKIFFLTRQRLLVKKTNKNKAQKNIQRLEEATFIMNAGMTEEKDPRKLKTQTKN